MLIHTKHIESTPEMVCSFLCFEPKIGVQRKGVYSAKKDNLYRHWYRLALYKENEVYI